MSATTRFPVAGESFSMMKPTISTGFFPINVEDCSTMNRKEYDGTMSVGVMEGYGNLFWKDGSHYSGQVEPF